MKQITIYEFLERNADIMPEGHVFYNPYSGWQYCASFNYKKPHITDDYHWYCNDYEVSLNAFRIEDWDRDWEDSLIKVEHKEEE